MDTQEEYFEIDEIDNLIDNLEMTAHFLESHFSYKWKWAIIALYQAFYGALISTLSGSDPRQTVIDRQRDSGKAVMLHVNRIPFDIIASSFGKNEETIRDWISNPYLISIEEALRRVKKKEYLHYSDAKPLVTSADEEDDIRMLVKEFRNEFVHFSPKGWVVFTPPLRRILSSILRIVYFLEFESNCVSMSERQEQDIKNAHKKVANLLSKGENNKI